MIWTKNEDVKCDEFLNAVTAGGGCTKKTFTYQLIDIKSMNFQRGVRSMLRQFVSNVATVHTEPHASGRALHISHGVKVLFNVVTLVTTGKFK